MPFYVKNTSIFAKILDKTSKIAYNRLAKLYICFWAIVKTKNEYIKEKVKMKMKKIISLFVCAIMVMAIIPVSIFMASAKDATLYENDFSTDAKVAEGDSVGSGTSCADGKLSFAGWNEGSYWGKTVTLNGTGTITLTATLYPNWQSGTNPVLTVNGKTVVWNAGSSQVKLGDDTTAYNSATNTAVYVTVTIDPTTGNATVVYDQTAAGYTKREATVNVGTVGTTLDVKFGYAENSWKADDLKVVQDVDDTAVKNITVRGYQQTKVNNGTWSVRFVATGKNVEGIEKVGFEVTLAGGKTVDKSTTVVYQSLNANYGAATVAASTYSDDYITAVAINNIPSTSGELEFTVKPYIVVGGVKQYGDTSNAKISPIDDSTITVASGSVQTKQIKTSDYSSGKIKITFNFAQNGTSSGGAGMNAALFRIDNNLGLRVTGGNATHVIDASGNAVSSSGTWWGYQGGDYPNTSIIFEATIDVASNSVSYTFGGDKSGTITGFDFSDGIIDLTFGGTSCNAVTITSFEITEVK